MITACYIDIYIVFYLYVITLRGIYNRSRCVTLYFDVTCLTFRLMEQKLFSGRPFQRRQAMLLYSVYLGVLQAIGAVLPLGVIVYTSLRIFVVVVRTTRRIAAEGFNIGTVSDTVDSMTVHQTAHPSPIGVTIRSIRSSRYILAICLFYVFVITYNVAVDAVSSVLKTDKKSMLAFTAIWLFFSNTSVNSFLYICLHRSFRNAAKKLFRRHACFERSNI